MELYKPPPPGKLILLETTGFTTPILHPLASLLQTQRLHRVAPGGDDNGQGPDQSSDKAIGGGQFLLFHELIGVASALVMSVTRDRRYQSHIARVILGGLDVSWKRKLLVSNLWGVS
ncbi:hypothetical protein YC2023_090658 [Brassica napus]